MKLLVCGLVLTALAWTAAWGRYGLITEFSFFPLWLGYILAVNGIGEALFQQSLVRRMGASFVALFALSVPMWWFFELMNSVVHNWHYESAYPISDLQFSVQASIDFSTVIPAVLSTAYLFEQFSIRYSRFAHCTPVLVRPSHLLACVAAGAAGFCMLPLFPDETFPLVWIAPLLLIEPLAYAARTPSLLRLLEQGRCRLAASIMAATLFTGVWWETWNYCSLPKWIYTIPYVGFWKIFEMPALGYFGYPFFGLIVFTYTGLLSSLVLKRDMTDVFDVRDYLATTAS
jgi:hypothetical protein